MVEINVDSLIDFANNATLEIAKYQVPVILNSDNLLSNVHAIASLDWQSIAYGDAEIDKVPEDKRGIYAFVVCRPSTVLPPHGYVLYIGIAGRGSNRPLRARYKEYLSVKGVRKRPRIARMIGAFHRVLRFYFAPVDDDISSGDLELMERQLNTAMMPPFSEGDLDADIKFKRRAFR